MFGPDGGRDNPDLGLIEARFRRELTGRGRPEPMPVPASSRPPFPMPPVPVPATPAPAGPFPRRPLAPPEWTPPGWNGPLADIGESLGAGGFPAVSSILTPAAPVAVPGTPRELPDALERAAGTGLTGSSAQEFVPIHLGPLEAEATVIKLRLVIGTEAAIAAPRPLPEPEGAPARPAARP